MEQTLDLEFEVAALYAVYQEFKYVAWIMEKKTRRPWTTAEVKRLLVRYVREQVGIRIGPGRPPFGGFRVPQKPS